MVPIENMLLDLRRMVERSISDGTLPSIVFNSSGLVDTILKGELRRKNNEFIYGIPIPRFCIFSVTWACNLRCRGCYARNYPGKGGLNLDAIEEAIRECCDLGSYLFVIVGGEPLLMPGLIETLAREKRGFFFLFTNGTVLDDSHCAAIAAASNILPILSIEGGASETDARRGFGVARRVDKAMQRLASSNVTFGFSAMISHANVSTVTSRQWFDDMWDKGARFGFMIDYVPADGCADPALVLTDADRRHRHAELSLRVQEARPLVMNFPPDEYAGDECQAAGKGFIHINADGFVEPCPFCHFAVDNIREKPLEEILDSTFFRAVRRFTGFRDNPDGECLLVAHRRELEEIAAQTGAERTDAARTALLPGECPEEELVAA